MIGSTPPFPSNSTYRIENVPKSPLFCNFICQLIFFTMFCLIFPPDGVLVWSVLCKRKSPFQRGQTARLFWIMEMGNSSKIMYRFALVDFFTDKTIHICDISELKHEDMTKLDQENLPKWNKLDEAFLLWRRTPTAEPERWPCHIIQISGECYLVNFYHSKALSSLIDVSLVALTQQRYQLLKVFQ